MVSAHDKVKAIIFLQHTYLTNIHIYFKNNDKTIYFYNFQSHKKLQAFHHWFFSMMEGWHEGEVWEGQGDLSCLARGTLRQESSLSVLQRPASSSCVCASERCWWIITGPLIWGTPTSSTLISAHVFTVLGFCTRSLDELI